MGYHELSGTKLSLKNPLLVLKKKKAVQEDGSISNDELELEVIGIIRHKILFRSRPKAIISSTCASLCLIDTILSILLVIALEQDRTKSSNILGLIFKINSNDHYRTMGK